MLLARKYRHYSNNCNFYYRRLIVILLIIYNCNIVKCINKKNNSQRSINNLVRRNSDYSFGMDGNNNNNNNNNLIMNNLSSCQTVCACKWKGGKQTVECIDRALITIPENIDQSTQVLDMSGNNLQILPHEQFLRSNLLNLQKLYLRNCHIGQIDDQAFKGLTNLVELDLSHNLLTSIPSKTFSYTISLRDLTLSSNHIQKVDSFSFKNIPSLNKLDLSYCDIQTIAPQAFEGLLSLNMLKLNGNKLAELRPQTIETLSRLHGIELHDNPWMCDCRLRSTKLWIMENNIPSPVSAVCSGGPERVIGKTFNELNIDDFACRPEILPINRYIETYIGDNITIICRTSAIPAANINWYWNGKLLINGSSFGTYQRIYIYEDGTFEKRSHLIITNSQENDSGEFYCIAENKAGTIETNFTLNIKLRQGGMASLGSGQIIGLSAALIIIILFILLITLFLLIKLRKTSYENKTPNHLEIITNVNQMDNTNYKQSNDHISNSNLVIQNGSAVIIKNENNDYINDIKLKNPLQKPPRLTDIQYTTNYYNNNANNNLLKTTIGQISITPATITTTSTTTSSSFISPTQSIDNNPDLINDTKKYGSDDEFIDLRIPPILDINNKIILNKLYKDNYGNNSGEYSRANGCDSLYPNELWDISTKNLKKKTITNDDVYIKRATSSTISGYNNYINENNQIIDNNLIYNSNMDGFSKTFPRTNFVNLTTINDTDTTTTNSTTISNNGYPSDYGLPLVSSSSLYDKQQYQQQNTYTNPINNDHKTSFEQQQQQPNHLNNLGNTNNNNINNNNKSNSKLPTILSNGMPINAKTIRVWQKGGVPVLPPVTALKRALTNNNRNSPDEGYQEGCGTDV